MVDFFAYGTLMFSEILSAVTGRSFESDEAELEGYIRYKIAGRPYPGIIRHPGTRTPGRLYRGLDHATMRVLDQFEGTLYERQTVWVRVRGRGVQPGEAYVIRESECHKLSRRPWDAQRFQQEWYEAYLQSCKEFRLRWMRGG